MALQNHSLLTCLVLASCCLGALGSTRELQATDVITHISIPYNRTLVGGDPLGQLSLTDPRLQRTVEGLTPEQVSTLRLVPKSPTCESIFINSCDSARGLSPNLSIDFSP